MYQLNLNYPPPVMDSHIVGVDVVTGRWNVLRLLLCHWPPRNGAPTSTCIERRTAHTSACSLNFACMWYDKLKGVGPTRRVRSTGYSGLCPLPAEKKSQGARAGFEPATLAFQCERHHHLNPELVQFMWWIRICMAVDTAWYYK